MSFNVQMKDLNNLAGELQRLNSIRFDAVKEKQLTQMFNRGKHAGGTPVDTGALKQSLGRTTDEVGYGIEYAPHVEYGHRTRGRGGFVPGQRFLLKNFQTQQPIYYEDLRKAIAKE